MELVSIIVPVYGVEAYIVECIESLINQSYKNIEILLIDDQSPDKCPEICEKYAEADKRIRVIHKRNGGAGSARNAGLRNYRGEYVCFVDGDDYVDTDYIQVLYDAVSKNNADIAVVDYQYLYKHKREKNEMKIGSIKQNNIEYLRKFLTRWNTGMMTNKIFKRDILSGILFVEGRRIDDEFFTYQAVMNAKYIIEMDKVLYTYRMRSSSVMNTEHQYYKEMLNDRIDYLTQRYEDVTKKYPQLTGAYLENYMDNLIQIKINGGIYIEIKNKIKLIIKQHFVQLLLGPVDIKAKIIFWRNIIFRKPKDVEKSNKKVEENEINYNYFE